MIWRVKVLYNIQAAIEWAVACSSAALAKAAGAACPCTAKKIPFMYSQKRKSGLSPSFHIHTVCLWAIYIFSGSVHLFSCSRIGRPIVGIYKSLKDAWMWKLGLRPHNSFSGNACFEFSVLCLCSVQTSKIKQIMALHASHPAKLCKTLTMVNPPAFSRRRHLWLLKKRLHILQRRPNGLCSVNINPLWKRLKQCQGGGEVAVFVLKMLPWILLIGAYAMLLN